MKLNLKLISIYFLFVAILVSGGFIIAGTITNDSTPVPTSYSLTDIYNLVHNNATTTEANHNLYPSSNTGIPTMYSISELYVELANLIDPASTTATYLGVTPNVTPDEVTPVTKESTPTSNSGTVTGFTLDDIYELIENNIRPLTPSHTFAPASSPADSGPTLTEIYDSLSTLITASDVATGTVYLGVTGTYVPTPTYTIVYDSQGGTPDFSTTTNILSGSTTTPPSEPTRDSYNFGGWFTQVDGGGIEFTVETTVTENITVYAKWMTDPCLDASDVGTRCAGGALYAGELNGSKYMVTAETVYRHDWEEFPYIVTNATSLVDGYGNTANLADRGERYFPANYCANLIESGHDDWFLPAKEELNLFYSNVIALKFDQTPYYPHSCLWTSTESAREYAWVISQADASFIPYVKNSACLVRCSRKY